MNIKKKVLEYTHSNSTEITAVLATLVDWENIRQCPKLGIDAFIKCGVTPSLIPLLINYLQGSNMLVKCHSKISTEGALNSGGSQGGYFGNLEISAY